MKKQTKQTLAALLAGVMLMGTISGCTPSAEDPSPSGSGQPGPSASAGVPSGQVEELGSGTVKWSEEKTADGWMKVTNEGGTTLGYSPDSGVKLIQVDGYAFKDLNRNGELDGYEDWRLDADTRAADLASQLPLDSMFGLMYHANLSQIDADAKDAQLRDMTFSQAMAETGLRTALNRGVGTTDAKLMATWNNNAQAQAEALDYGIPVNMSSNPVTPSDMGFANNMAMSATFDPAFVQSVFTLQSKLFRATGITTNLGPQIDLATEPRWNRTFSTFTEDPALATEFAAAAVTGLQSTFDANGNDLGWGPESVIAMMKHWPGDAPGENGRESHSDSGKYTVYPGDNFNTILMPFADGALNLDSATERAAGAMTSYSIAYSENDELGELVASPYSEFKLNLLREELNFDGLICSDWGSLTSRGYGVEDLSEAERIAMMIKVGMDQLGGVNVADFDGAYEILKDDVGEDEALALVQNAARRIVKTFFLVGIFDNAYLNVNDTVTLYASDEVADMKHESLVKSVVMLKNDNNAISAASGSEKPTVYVPLAVNMTYDNFANIKGSTIDLPWDRSILDQYYNVVTDSLGEPTGKDADGNAIYLPEDIIRASAEELVSCSAALVMISNPVNEGSEGDGFGHDSETDEYFPISLQYGEYTADSASVRTPSISGDMVEKEVTDVYGTIVVTTKEDRSYAGASARILNGYALDLVKYVADVMPESANVILCVDTDKTLIVNEFESDVDALLLGYRIPYNTYLEIVAGQVEPSGLLPLQIPANMETVEAQLEDVPRDMECYVDANGNTYDFGFGMNWSGVIQDERTEKYCVPPLTAPEALAGK